MVVRNGDGTLRVILGKQPDTAARIEESLPPAQYPKPILVDDESYMPGVGLMEDWALGYLDLGGEA